MYVSGLINRALNQTIIFYYVSTTRLHQLRGPYLYSCYATLRLVIFYKIITLHYIIYYQHLALSSIRLRRLFMKNCNKSNTYQGQIYSVQPRYSLRQIGELMRPFELISQPMRLSYFPPVVRASPHYQMMKNEKTTFKSVLKI